MVTNGKSKGENEEIEDVKVMCQMMNKLSIVLSTYLLAIFSITLPRIYWREKGLLSISGLIFISFFNRQLELTVSDAHMDAFRQQLQSEQKQAIIEKEQELHIYTDVTM